MNVKSLIEIAADWAECTRVRDADAANARDNRDTAIRWARKEEGATIAELSRDTGLTRTMLYKIINKEEA